MRCSMSSAIQVQVMVLLLLFFKRPAADDAEDIAEAAWSLLMPDAPAVYGAEEEEGKHENDMALHSVSHHERDKDRERERERDDLAV